MDRPIWVSVPNTDAAGVGGGIMGHGAFTGSQLPSEQSATTFRDQGVPGAHYQILEK